MNAVVKSSLYFSAYPLKVLEQVASKPHDNFQSPYLQAILAGKTKYSEHLRVTPMKLSVYRQSPTNNPRIKENAAEPTGKDWFNHYE